jgi:hypothetical protein
LFPLAVVAYAIVIHEFIGHALVARLSGVQV